MAILGGQIPIVNRTFLGATSRSAASIFFTRSSFANYARSEARLFGANASQDINNIYIKKSDLSLNTSKLYTAEALFVALLLRAKKYESDKTSRVEVKYFTKDWLIVNGVPIQQDTLVVNLYGDLAYSNSPNPGMTDHILNPNIPIDASNFFSS